MLPPGRRSSSPAATRRECHPTTPPRMAQPIGRRQEAMHYIKEQPKKGIRSTSSRGYLLSGGIALLVVCNIFTRSSSQQRMCAADFAEDSERLLAWADADMSPSKSQACGRVCAVLGSSAGAMRTPTCGGMKHVLSRAARVNLRPMQTAAQPNRSCDRVNRRLGCTRSFNCDKCFLTMNSWRPGTLLRAARAGALSGKLICNRVLD